MINLNVWPNPSSSSFSTLFVARDKIKAQTQLDANLAKMKKRLIECNSRLKELNV